MTYATLTDYNASEGIYIPLLYVNDITGGLFVNMMLLAFFCIICFGSYFIQRRTSGIVYFPVNFAVAGYVTLGLASLLSLIPGLINIYALGIIIAVAVLGTIWLFFGLEK